MFRIKICGVKTLDDVREAVRAGADAIGLNFYEGSPRCLTVLQAKDLAKAVPNPVGVFVNATADEINRIATEVGLSWVQLHGDEPPELLADIQGEFKIIRAIRFDQRGVEQITAYIEACRTAGREPEAVLVDALTPGHYGGTGETVAWAGLADYRKWLGDIPLVLAGGLTPENVAEAIRTVRPYGVDVASGVEDSPGVKDHAKMQAFVEAAGTAFAALES